MDNGIPEVIVRFIRVINSACNVFLRKKNSVIKVLERGFPFWKKIGGIPNCPLSTSQTGNPLPKTSVLNIIAKMGP